MAAVDEKVKQIIVEQLQVDEAEVTPSATFQEDLGADSLDVVELVMQFEEAFDMEIPDEDAEKIKTVKDAIEYIEKHAKGERSNHASDRTGRGDGTWPHCGPGNTAPRSSGRICWRGKSGMAPITGFDATGFPVTFAAEVKNFDPLQFIEKKEARKMGALHPFRLAAAMRP